MNVLNQKNQQVSKVHMPCSCFAIYPHALKPATSTYGRASKLAKHWCFSLRARWDSLISNVLKYWVETPELIINLAMHRKYSMEYWNHKRLVVSWIKLPIWA